MQHCAGFISAESLYMFRATSVHHQEYLKLVQRPLVHVLSLQVSHHIFLLGPVRFVRYLLRITESSTTKGKEPEMSLFNRERIRTFRSSRRTWHDEIKLLNSTCHEMNHQFKAQQLYAQPTLNLWFCIYLRTNSDLCHLQHKMIGFYSRDEKCLQRGTDWFFK